MTALLAILSAVLIGSADFAGGFGSRSASPLRVAALAQAAGLPLAFLLAVAFGAERLSGTDVGWSLASGVAGAAGLGCFYTAMGRGLISVVAPLAAVVGATIPVSYALVSGERPGTVALIGITVALVAVVAVSVAPSDPRHAHVAVTPSVVLLALLAGILFGVFFICFSRVSEDAGLWPVALERVASTSTLVVLALAFTRGRLAIGWGLARLVITIGVLEVAATVPLLLALQRGPISVASVLASLYPVTTVLLATFVLHERMSRLQLGGVALALAAIVLVTAG